MTRRELLERTSSHDLTELMAYERIEPFPGERLERIEIMLAQLAMLTANINRDRKMQPTPFGLADFLLPVDPQPAVPKPELSPIEVSDKVVDVFSRLAGG